MDQYDGWGRLSNDCGAMVCLVGLEPSPLNRFKLNTQTQNCQVPQTADVEEIIIGAPEYRGASLGGEVLRGRVDRRGAFREGGAGCGEGPECGLEVSRGAVGSHALSVLLASCRRPY